MAKRKKARGGSPRVMGGKAAGGPRIEQLIARHRIEVIEDVLHRLQTVEPETFARLDKRRNKLSRNRLRISDSDPHSPARDRGSKERYDFAQLLRDRHKKAASIRKAIVPHLPMIAALEDQCLPDRGFVGEMLPLFGTSDPVPSPAPLQRHMRSKDRRSWQSSVFRCAAKCPLAGAECIEPAILACIRILRSLRDLVDDDGTPTADEAAVFDERGRLREPARLFLATLDQPMRCTLDRIAKKAERKEEYFRHVTAPLQNLGFVRLHDGAWTRTHEGAQLLRP